MSVATVQSVATVVTVMSVLSAESAENRDGQDTCTVLYSAMHGLGPIDHPSRDTGGGSRGGSMGSMETLFWRAAFENTMR